MKRLNFYISVVCVILGFSINAQTPNSVGDAQPLLDDCFLVTPNEQFQNGAVWYSEQLDLTEYFALNFEVYMGDQDQFGADGIVFVMQQVGIDALGNDGFGLGFSGFSPSFGIELDTYQNDDAFDPPEDHMAMFRDGEVYHSGFTSITPAVPIFPDASNVENGLPFSFKLVWNPLTQEIQAYVNCELRISQFIDLEQDVFQGDPFVYWGFTGSTGWFSNEQVVCFTELEYLHPTEEETICLGDDYELSIATPEATNIQWSANVWDQTSLTPIISPTESAEYTVSYEKCGEFFTDTTRVEVTILEIEDVESQSICSGDQANFEVNYAPGLDVLWSNTDSQDEAVFENEGTHWVEVTDGVCVRRKYFDLTLQPLPEITIPESVEYCFADSSVVSFSSSGSDLFLPDGFSGSEFYIDSESTYQVQAVDQNTGCVGYAQTIGVELPLPNIELSEFYEICPYEELTVEVNTDYTVLWNNASVENEQVFSDEGTYSVEAELDGCYSEHDFDLQVNPLPDTSVPGVYEYCEDTELLLTSDNSGYDFQWPSGVVSPSYTFNQEGVFNIQVTDQVTGCLIIDQVETIMILNPTIEMEDEYELCEGDKITIEPEVANADSIIWSTGILGEEYEFSNPEMFTVTVTNECLAVPFESEVVGILCDCTAFIPLAFTPDNNGLNELFKPVLTCEPFEYELIIFDRLGHIIFRTNDPLEAWVGNAKGGAHYVKADTYTYKLSYQALLFDGIHAETKYGMVSVIR